MKEIPGLRYTSPHTFSFKQRLILKAGPPLAGLVLKVLTATCRVEVRDASYFDQAPSEGGHAILAAWHEAFGLGVPLYRDSGIHTLTSLSFDGELASRLVRQFGLFALRGSSSRGGGEALRCLTAALDHIPVVGFTLDGPRGPRRVAKPGIAILSARSKAPVIPLACAASRAWRLKSWDRFIVPKPGARIVARYGAPIPPP
ncbi:MAG: DUF374 domain-containing protein, partial [Nitrospiraceae bacterium]|nr:DUF374 domain-containing protein [Nitrospiraceae bacterium]